MFSFKKLFFPYNRLATDILSVIKQHPQGITFDDFLDELRSTHNSMLMTTARVEFHLSRMIRKDIVSYRRPADSTVDDERRYMITERGKSIHREGKRFHLPRSHTFVVGKSYRLKGDLRVFTILRQIAEDTTEFREGYRYVDNFGTMWREDGSYETAKGRRETKAHLALEMMGETFTRNQEAYL